MKKLIAIISGVSMAALIGGVSFADEENENEKPVGEEIQAEDDVDTPAPTKDYNTTRSNFTIKKGGGNEDEDKSPDLTHTRMLKEGYTLPKADVEEDDEASQMKRQGKDKKYDTGDG